MLFKLQEAGEILAKSGEFAALRFASRLGCLGSSRDVIQRGWSAHQNPDFYRQLGQDPDQLYRAAIQALKSLIAANS